MPGIAAAWMLWAAASVSAAPGHWAEPLKLRVGPDGNACGLLAPAPAEPRGIIVWLHGGMGSGNREKGWEAWRALPPFLEAGSRYVGSPSAHAGADWLSPQGIAHIEALLDTAAKLFPVRMDSLILAGVSDGCLGALQYARLGRRKPARFILFSAYPALAVAEAELLSSPAFAQTRWDVFQGGRDRLFPAAEVFPLLRRWAKANPKVTLHPYPDGEHDFSWYGEHADAAIRGLFNP